MPEPENVVSRLIANVCACKQQPVCETESVDQKLDFFTIWACISALPLGFALLCMWAKINRMYEVIARLRASERDHELISLIRSDVEIRNRIKDATITRIRDRVQRLGVEAHGAAFVIQNLQTQLSDSRGTAARSEQRGNRGAAVSSTDLVRRLTLVAREHEGALRQRSLEEYGEYVRQALQKGMRIRMLEDYETVSAGDEGEYIGIVDSGDDGTPLCYGRWDSISTLDSRVGQLANSCWRVHWRMVQIIDPASTAGFIDPAMDEDDLQTECAICTEPVIDPVPREPNQQSTTTLGCSHKYRECTKVVNSVCKLCIIIYNI
jgi:hypothetical protein